MVVYNLGGQPTAPTKPTGPVQPTPPPTHYSQCNAIVVVLLKARLEVVRVSDSVVGRQSLVDVKLTVTVRK